MCFPTLFYCNPFYSASIAVNWCHLATVIKILTDSLMELCKVYSNCFPQGYTHRHIHTRKVHLQTLFLPHWQGTISSQAQLSLSLYPSLSLSDKTRERVKRGGCSERTGMSLINSQFRLQYCIVMRAIHIHEIPLFTFSVMFHPLFFQPNDKRD